MLYIFLGICKKIAGPFPTHQLSKPPGCGSVWMGADQHALCTFTLALKTCHSTLSACVCLETTSLHEILIPEEPLFLVSIVPLEHWWNIDQTF
jgi:hypothetical protein